LSVSLPEVPYVLELGAMRYLPNQVLVASLIEHLKIDTADFTFKTTGYSLRSKYVPSWIFKKRTGSNGNSLRYHLTSEEKGKNPSQLIVFAIQKALQHITIQPPSPDDQALYKYYSRDIEGNPITNILQKLRSIEEVDASDLLNRFEGKQWRVIRRYGYIDHHPLRDLGFWDLVQSHLTTEAYNLAHDGSGYQSILNMWNAAEGIVWYLSDFASDSYKTIVSGMGTLVGKLHHAILYDESSTQNEPIEGDPIQKCMRRDNTDCKLGWKLTRVVWDKSSSRFHLRFRRGEFVRGEELDDADVIAEKVILALPQPALKELEIEHLQVKLTDKDDLQAKLSFHGYLDAVTANPLFKAFLVYAKPWWKKRETVPSCFRVFTDLPLRQIYHFGKARQYDEDDDLSAKSKRNSYCLIMAYSDSRFADYWLMLDRMGMGRTKERPYYKLSFKRSIAPGKHQELDRILRDYGTCEEVWDRARRSISKSLSEKGRGYPRTADDAIKALV
jgi:hypothetical protein